MDVNGHVNNVVYVQWMQDVAVLHSVAEGYNTAEYERLDAIWVVRSHNIEYLNPTFVGETIEASTWAVEIKRATALRKYEFVRVSDQKLLAKAETKWIYVKASTGRPCSIPEEVKSLFIGRNQPI